MVNASRQPLLYTVAKRMAEEIRPNLRKDNKNFEALFKEIVLPHQRNHDLTDEEIARIRSRVLEIIQWLRKPHRPATLEELEKDRDGANRATGLKFFPRQLLLGIF